MKKLQFTLLVLLNSATFFAQPAIQWQKTFGGTHMDGGGIIRQTPDHGLLVVGVSWSQDIDISDAHGWSDIWIAKFADPTFVYPPTFTPWKKNIGGSGYDEVYWMELTDDGGCVLAGISSSNNGDISGNHGDVDFLIMKMDEFGNIQWQKSLGGSMEDFGHTFCKTADGGI